VQLRPPSRSEGFVFFEMSSTDQSPQSHTILYLLCIDDELLSRELYIRLSAVYVSEFNRFMRKAKDTDPA
jgi:hypothetical protein